MAMYIPQLSGRIRVKWRRAYDVARTKRRGRRLGRAPGRGVRYATRSHARGREGKHLCPSSAYRALRVRLRSQSQSPNETAVSLRANGARLTGRLQPSSSHSTSTVLDVSVRWPVSC
ncbi:unnamed protein product [Gadus morhua 'NCC']